MNATFTVPKKRKLTPMEKKEVEAFKKALFYLKKDHADVSCELFVPACAACEYHMLLSLLTWHISNLEY